MAILPIVLIGWAAPRCARSRTRSSAWYTLLEQGALDTPLPRCIATGVSIILAAPFNSGILVTGAVPDARDDYLPAPADVMERVARIETRLPGPRRPVGGRRAPVRARPSGRGDGHPRWSLPGRGRAECSLGEPGAPSIDSGGTSRPRGSSDPTRPCRADRAGRRRCRTTHRRGGSVVKGRRERRRLHPCTSARRPLCPMRPRAGYRDPRSAMATLDQSIDHTPAEPTG